MGTEGSIEITLIPYGDGMWFRDPMKVRMGEKKKKGDEEEWVAGATVADSLEQGEGLPIVPGIKDLDSPDVGFVEKEMEFAKRWLYQKGIMVPSEDKDPEYKNSSASCSTCATAAGPTPISKSAYTIPSPSCCPRSAWKKNARCISPRSRRWAWAAS